MFRQYNIKSCIASNCPCNVDVEKLEITIT
nr:MAG TPA: hypothetical protein [Caudoviricetes sp.]